MARYKGQALSVGSMTEYRPGVTSIEDGDARAIEDPKGGEAVGVGVVDEEVGEAVESGVRVDKRADGVGEMAVEPVGSGDGGDGWDRG